MKIIYVATTLMLLTFNQAVYSQENLSAGRSMLGASMQFHQNQNEERTFYSISPAYGYFLKNNTSIGLAVDFSNAESTNSFSTSQFNGLNTRKNFSIGLKPFVKKYHPVKGGFGTFFKSVFSCTWGRHDFFEIRTNIDNANDVETSWGNTDIRVFDISLKLGLYYLINDRFSVETSLGSLALSHSRVFNSTGSGNSERSSTNLFFTNTFQLNQPITFNYFF